VLLISLGILVAGMIGSLVLMVRSGELRAGLLAACFALFAVRQAIATYRAGNDPLTFDPVGIAELALVAASAVGGFVLVGLWRSLSERDRAETQHWDSMEAVRTLSELAVRWDMSLDEKFDALLKAGCARFGLEIGVISRVEQQRYEVLAICAPEDHPVALGDVFELADTWCEQTLRGTRPLGLERTADATPPPRAERAPFEFGAYLATAVQVYGEVVGTVAFGSLGACERRFTATDKDFVNLIAQWIGTELERRLAAEERTLKAAPISENPMQRPRARAIAGAVDINRALRLNENNLRRLVGDRAVIEFRLADDLRPAVKLRIGIGAVVESLTRATADALGPGGRISIATSNLDFEQPEGNRLDSGSAERHSTIEVTATGPEVDAEALGRMFESDATESVPRPDACAETHVPVSHIARLLRKRGGDLSLDVEPGVATTFTVYHRSAEVNRPDSRAELPNRRRADSNAVSSPHR
jgi:GAF domain-containing protein